MTQDQYKTFMAEMLVSTKEQNASTVFDLKALSIVIRPHNPDLATAYMVLALAFDNVDEVIRKQEMS